MLRVLLSPRQVRLVRKPALLPAYYKHFAEELEPLLDQQQNPGNADADYWGAMARKYAHILDKGLQRADFEPGHSRRWHQAALNALSRAEAAGASDASIEWAKGVVANYERRQKCPAKDEQEFVAPVAPAEFQTLRRIIQGRRSVRRYDGRPVETEKLDQIAEAVNWSPTSCNRQPAKVFIATDPILVRKCAATCAGATCFSGDGACFLAFCADQRVYYMPEEFLLPNVDVGLGIQNCLLVAHALGVSITMLSWAQHTAADEPALRGFLGIPNHLRIIVNALAGYPALLSETPGRKGSAATVVYANPSEDKRSPQP